MKIPKRLTRLGMLFASLVVALAATERAQATPIPASNHTFETPALGAGGWSNDLPVSAGLEDPQWLDPETPTNGNRFIEFIGGFFSEGTQHIGTAAGYFLYQNLGIPYEPNTTYTLTVGVG